MKRIKFIIAIMAIAGFMFVGKPFIEANTSDYGYASIINGASEKYGVPAALIAAIIKAESNFNPRARSHRGAIGLMQIDPATREHLRLYKPYDPKANVSAGTKYFSYLLKIFDGDVKLALAAYNAGPGNVRKYGDVPPFPQTQNYIPKVLKYYSEFSGVDA